MRLLSDLFTKERLGACKLDVKNRAWQDVSGLQQKAAENLFYALPLVELFA